MRTSRIIVLIMFVALSLGVIRFLESGQKRTIGGAVSDTAQKITATVADTVVSQAGGDRVPEVSAQSSPASDPDPAAGGQCGSGIKARIALVRYLDSNKMVFERNADGRWPIASITKLMTAVIASERTDLSKSITFTDAMTAAEGNAGGFVSGETMSGTDILKGMLLVSSNDAAEAIAQSYGRDAFITLMNEKAKELRMLDTRYFDPSGLSAKNQATSGDLYKLMDYLYASHPEILEITRQRKAIVIDLQGYKKRTIGNIDEFAGRPDFIGGKTGHIEESDGNLVTVFNKNGEQVVIVVLGSPDRFGETKQLLQCI